MTMQVLGGFRGPKRAASARHTPALAPRHNVTDVPAGEGAVVTLNVSAAIICRAFTVTLHPVVDPVIAAPVLVVLPVAVRVTSSCSAERNTIGNRLMVRQVARIA